MAEATPLISRASEVPFAVRGGRPVSVDRFLGDVLALAEQLPDRPYLTNLCANRYRFQVAFCAAIVRRQTNLLPPNRQPGTLEDLRKTHPDSYAVADWGEPSSHQLLFPRLDSAPEVAAKVPVVDDDHLCALAFTSGSTGPSAAVPKTWRTIRLSSARNAPAYLGDGKATCSIIATVPPQHMYGLETTVMLPLFAPVTIHDGCPLLPQDVADALAQMSAPRMLVSTPTHLRALVQAPLRYPRVATVLSATAPLTSELAGDIECILGAALREIYGCSEAGSLALRRTATDCQWQLFEGFKLRHTDDEATVEAAHLPQPVPLQDVLELHGEGRFSILGRKSDLLNVAGKRGSLADLNQRLLAVPGVRDGVIFEPDDNAPRLAALVVGDVSRASITASLKQHFDPVFIPRPILFVASLPRSAAGKLPRAVLLEAYARARAG